MQIENKFIARQVLAAMLSLVSGGIVKTPNDNIFLTMLTYLNFMCTKNQNESLVPLPPSYNTACYICIDTIVNVSC